MELSIGTSTKPFYLPHFDETEGERAGKGSRSTVFKNGKKIHGAEFLLQILSKQIPVGAMFGILQFEAASLLECARDLQNSAFGEVWSEDLHADWQASLVLTTGDRDSRDTC